MTKAGTVVESIPNPESHVALILRYKSTYARVLDANRKFLQAAQRYHDLSQSATDIIDADDVFNMLGRAATCAILSPSGAQRQRVLGHVRSVSGSNKISRFVDSLRSKFQLTVLFFDSAPPVSVPRFIVIHDFDS